MLDMLDMLYLSPLTIMPHGRQSPAPAAVTKRRKSSQKGLDQGPGRGGGAGGADGRKSSSEERRPSAAKGQDKRGSDDTDLRSKVTKRTAKVSVAS
jgi:hypothetical protein